jgi:hypothetical protein
MLAVHTEEVATPTLRHRAGETDASTRATDAKKLPGRLFLIGRELHPIDGQDGVKAFIRERQRLGIGDAKSTTSPSACARWRDLSISAGT